MKKIPFLLFIGLIFLQGAAQAVLSDYDTEFATNTRTHPGYFQNMADDWRRGLTNIVSSPLEIPMTIKKYHEQDSGLPVLRHTAGFLDGILRSVARCGSGMWDIGVSFLPGDQEGGPVEPATLF